MIRLDLKDYDSVVRQFKDKKLTFKVTKTSYTKRIKLGKQTVLFADKPMSVFELKLIQQIRQSADTFEVPSLEQASPEIDFYKFYDVQDGKGVDGVKIDLTQAYWQTAINMGLVTPEIQFYFEKHKDKIGSEKDIKHARLRTLGALATKTTKQEYIDGVMVHEELVVNKPRRELYLYICEQVSLVMHEVAHDFIEHILYFYWDCIFLSDKVDITKVKKKIKKLGYNCKVEGKGKYEIFQGKHFSYLHDTDKNVKYPINGSDFIN